MILKDHFNNPNSIIVHLKHEQGWQWLEFFQDLTTRIDLELK